MSIKDGGVPGAATRELKYSGALNGRNKDILQIGRQGWAGLDGDNPAGGLMGQGKMYSRSCSVRQVPSARGSPACTRGPAAPGRETEQRCVWKHGLEAVEGREGQGCLNASRGGMERRGDARSQAPLSTKPGSPVSFAASMLQDGRNDAPGTPSLCPSTKHSTIWVVLSLCSPVVYVQPGSLD